MQTLIPGSPMGWRLKRLASFVYRDQGRRPGLQSTNGINKSNWLIGHLDTESGSGHPVTATMWMWHLIGMGIGLIDGNIIGNIEKERYAM